MRTGWIVLILIVGLIISGLVYLATGGRFVFFFLPLLFALPLLTRRR